MNSFGEMHLVLPNYYYIDLEYTNVNVVIKIINTDVFTLLILLSMLYH